jgi:hypothetical protein
MSRGFMCARLRCTYPDVPEPRGVARPTLSDIFVRWSMSVKRAAVGKRETAILSCREDRDREATRL